jgi:lipopolysaccharide/colanic/teichoic acid biosynthesis glycosyltransferase
VIKRLMDVVLSAVALVVVSPLLAVAALGIWLSDKGQIFYRAQLAGRDGRPFTMYKLRTMRVDHGTFRSVITADHDPRVFRFGGWLRRAKIDELPQLFNILRGEMSIVGPRPEHPRIVDQYYAPEHRRLLQVRPGLTSPGTLYDYAHGEAIVGRADPERAYVERLLPLRLALDLVYVDRPSLAYDLALIGRTVALIVAVVCGRGQFGDPPEMAEARRLLTATGDPVPSRNTATA